MSQINKSSEHSQRLIPALRSVTVPDLTAQEISNLLITYREAGDPRLPTMVLRHGIGSNSTGFSY
jgi:hypothetical protein